jgi:hypothetical protein
MSECANCAQAGNAILTVMPPSHLRVHLAPCKVHKSSACEYSYRTQLGWQLLRLDNTTSKTVTIRTVQV